VPGITPHLGAKFFVIYKTNLVKKNKNKNIKRKPKLKG
jgi:hypothetical protein